MSKKGKVTAQSSGRTKLDVQVDYTINQKKHTKKCVVNVRVTDKEISSTNPEFYSTSFDKKSDIFARIKGKSYKDNCTVPVEDLNIASDLLEIFEELYDKSYPS